MSTFQLAQLNIAQMQAPLVYKSAHVEVMRRRKEWFERMAQAYVVLWWVPAGHRPTIEEASERLDLPRERGPTPRTFTFRTAFAPPDAARPETPFAFGDACPAT